MENLQCCICFEDIFENVSNCGCNANYCVSCAEKCHKTCTLCKKSMGITEPLINIAKRMAKEEAKKAIKLEIQNCIESFNNEIKTKVLSSQSNIEQKIEHDYNIMIEKVNKYVQQKMNNEDKKIGNQISVSPTEVMIFEEQIKKLINNGIYPVVECGVIKEINFMIEGFEYETTIMFKENTTNCSNFFMYSISKNCTHICIEMKSINITNFIIPYNSYVYITIAKIMYYVEKSYDHNYNIRDKFKLIK